MKNCGIMRKMKMNYAPSTTDTWSKHLYYLHLAANGSIRSLANGKIYRPFQGSTFYPNLVAQRSISLSKSLNGGDSDKYTRNGKNLIKDDYDAAATAFNDLEDDTDYPDEYDEDFDDCGEDFHDSYMPSDYDRAVGRLPVEQQMRFSQTPDSPPDSKVLRVAIIGSPNSGKSTLINSLMGWKVNGVSRKVHTTEKNTLCMFTHGNTQIVFIDTPGVMTSEARRRHNCSTEMEKAPLKSVVDADIIGVIIDCADTWERRFHENVLEILHENSDKPSFLLLNKVDLLRHKDVTLNVTRQLTNGVIGGQSFGKKVVEGRQTSEEEQWKDKEGFEILFEELQTKYGKIDMNKQLDLEFKEPEVMDTLDSVDKVDEDPTASDASAIHLGEDSYQKEFLEEILLKDTYNENSKDLSKKDASDANRGKEKTQGESWVKQFEEVQRKSQEYKKNYWTQFDTVFPVSALTGDGLGYIVEFLLNQAKPSPWLYHSSVVTNQDPVEIAKMCVRQSILDHVDGYVPYVVNINILYWDINANNRLDIVMEIVTQNTYEMGLLLANKEKPQAVPSGLRRKEKMKIKQNFNLAEEFLTPTSKIAKISSDARQALLDAFRCEVKFKLTARQDRSTKRSYKAKTNHAKQLVRRPVQSLTH